MPRLVGDIDKLPQTLSLEILLDDEVGGFAVLAVFGADVVHDGNIRVIQRRRGAGFLLEARKALGIGGKLCREHLDGDFSAQAGVLGKVNFTHTAGAELLENLVGSQRISDHDPPPSPRRVVRQRGSRRVAYVVQARLDRQSQGSAREWPKIR